MLALKGLVLFSGNGVAVFPAEEEAGGVWEAVEGAGLERNSSTDCMRRFERSGRV